MNLYLIVLLLLAAGAVLEWFKPKYQQKIFTVCWCVTMAVVALRFGAKAVCRSASGRPATHT